MTRKNISPAAPDTNPVQEKEVIFIEHDTPPLKSGEYTITLEQKVNLNTGNPYSISRKFAVNGRRFTLDPGDFNAVFPPDLSNGEFAGVLPLVVFNTRTLPWERTSVADQTAASWLTVLSFNSDEVPEIKKLTVADLVPAGTPITVAGSPVTGTGTMPAGFFSYPGLNALSYGEKPADPVNVIEVHAALFNKIAPSATDLPLLAHIRETETIDKTDNKISDEAKYAVVTGNRIPKENDTCYAFLVSLENLGNYLPVDDGTSHLPVGTSYIRLITHNSWHFTVNNGKENFAQLLGHVNKNAEGLSGLTSLRFPFEGTPPTTAEVQNALKDQAADKMTSEDAKILVRNALMMGYIPLTHTLRRPGNTVSWFRSPAVPLIVKETLKPPFSTPDAINRYNPDTGMFDVSYGAAWQIGQLMALQNKAFSTSLYNWKKGETRLEVIAAEQKIIDEKYKSINAFDGLMNMRRMHIADADEATLPDNIVKWLIELAKLNGLPFNYIVPDERMLPPESMRFFYLDNNWIDCLLDGAFSIGNSSAADEERAVTHRKKIMPAVKRGVAASRKRKQALVDYENTSGLISGFVLRSAAVGGWPGLEINGYSDKDGKNEIPKIRMQALSEDTLICLFDGDIKMVSVHEAPETLHGGIDKAGNSFEKKLRIINGDDPGKQIPGAVVQVPMRADAQTILVQQLATLIKTKLNAPPYNENIQKFTSAEYALEMIKGAVKVDFLNE